MPDASSYATTNRPTWCPGCGNYGIFEALKHALSALAMEVSSYSIVWGIGCHGNGADFLRTAGFHALHGRALPVASALSLARPDLKVIAIMGDGDGYGLGMGHFVHSLRRNIDITCITCNNQVYGLTTGQASPTTERMARTVSTPTGVLETPANSIGLALAQNAPFVARGFAGDVPHLTDLFTQALAYPGFGYVDVFQPCVTWNRINTAQWFRERVYRLEETSHDPHDRLGALELSLSTFREMTCTPDECTLPIGLFHLDESAPTYNEGVPASQEPAWKRAVLPRDVTELMMKHYS